MRLLDSAVETLEHGGVVVTSSARAARALRRSYAGWQRNRGFASWVSPEILDWDRWLAGIWQARLRSGGETRLLLSGEQEHRIWTRLIAPSIEGKRLISTAGVADLAQNAYALLGAYNSGRLPSLSSFESPDVTAFLGWTATFKAECSRHGWVSQSSLAQELRNTAPEAFPRQILLIGFDRVTPAVQQMLDRCVESGSAIDKFPLPSPAPIEAFIRARDPREEVELCARWARKMLDSSPGDVPPRIAVVVPDQASRGEEIERIFREVICAGDSPLSTNRSLPFEFSLGPALSQMPMVRAAQLLLRWTEQGIAHEDATWLLLSGFLWKEDFDLLYFARLDTEKRRGRLLSLEQGLDDYLHGSCWNQFEATKSLAQRLRSARGLFRKEGTGRLRFDQWTDLAQRILDAAGWPGSRKLTSEEFQVESRWAHLLDQIAALSFEGRMVDYSEFLSVVDRAANQTIFSAESYGAPIQILGPIEAAGMEFDLVWFLGADDKSWPLPGDAHPLLPRGLQIERGMPHASSSEDWELAKLVTERLQGCSGRMIASYAAQAADGPRRPSTIFFYANLSGGNPEVLTSEEFRSQTSLEAPQEKPRLLLEEIREPALGPAWPAGQHAGGGTYLLKNQAACPFRAFATYRLAAREIDPPDWGLNPAERGILLHQAMAGFWSASDMKDSVSLRRAHVEGKLRQRIQDSCSAVLEPFRKRAGIDGWSLAYLRLQQRRLEELIEGWLSIELTRADFTVEEGGIEKDMNTEIGGLPLTMRADRVDRTAGGRLILDYKSSKMPSLDWEDDRPDEPQLPLYAAYGGLEDLEGVLLAQIRPGDIRIADGCVRNPDALLPGLSLRGPEYSDSLQERWQSVLLNLAGQFAAGEAAIDPKHYPETCEYCALSSLCRIAEQNRDDSAGNGITAEEIGALGDE